METFSRCTSEQKCSGGILQVNFAELKMKREGFPKVFAGKTLLRAKKLL